MEISVIDESAFDDPDLSMVHHGSRRKLADEFDNMVAEKKPRLDDTALADQEHMRVYLRVRPFTEKEVEKQENQGCMEVEHDHLLVARAPVGSNTYKNSQHGCGKQTHKFTFSKIFTQETSQKEFFDNTLLDTVKDFMEGSNSLIFTYGVTNSGKTYTIQGHAKDGGILPRALDVLFNSIGGRQWESMSLKPSMFCDVMKLSEGEQELEQKIKQRVLDLAVADEESDVTVSSMVADSDSSRLTIGSRMSEDSLNIDSGHGSEVPENSDKSAIDQLFKEAAERVREDAAVNVTSQGQINFSVWVTFVEIYNEYIYDLLEPIPKKKTARRTTLTLREDKHGIPYVKGVKEIQVSTADEAYKILVIGKQNLQMACTKLNHNSSRSHCIFTIKLLRILDVENPQVARVSMLSFCDLAGAERYSKTLSAGDRIKEAGNINTSLLSLGRCIKILRHNQLNKEHQQMVPFRDSKLTRIFQSFLTGKGKASMIVNINQCASTFDETLHALKYSAIAKQVVIVQDAPKEPEQVNKPVVPRSSRYVSLMLAQAAANPKGPRPTIGFGTPGTLARILQEEEDEAETPKAKEDSQETVLMEIIDTLKEELVKERTEKDMLEWNIRNEVYQEMQEQLANHEREYEDRLRDMKERMEDRADSKVNLLLMSMKKKKRRRNDEEEDELNESDLLKAAIEAKESQIQLLEEKVEEYEKELTMVDKDPRHTPVTPKTPAVATPTTQTDQMAVIEQLQDKLMDSNAQLKAKEAEVAELGEMLTEAGETFEQKAAEIEKFEKDLEAFRSKSSEQEARIEELARLLKEAETAKADAESQLDLTNQKVKSLTTQLDAANEKGTCALHDSYLAPAPSTYPAASCTLSYPLPGGDITAPVVPKIAVSSCMNCSTCSPVKLKLTHHNHQDHEDQYASSTHSDASDASLSAHDVTLSPVQQNTSTPNNMILCDHNTGTVRRRENHLQSTDEKLGEFIMSRKRKNKPDEGEEGKRYFKDFKVPFRFQPYNESIHAGRLGAELGVRRSPRVSEMPSINYSHFTPAACSSIQILDDTVKDDDTLEELTHMKKPAAKSKWFKFGRSKKITEQAKKENSECDKTDYLRQKSGSVVKHTKSSRLRAQLQNSHVVKGIKSTLKGKGTMLSMSNLGVKTRSMKTKTSAFF